MATIVLAGVSAVVSMQLNLGGHHRHFPFSLQTSSSIIRGTDVAVRMWPRWSPNPIAELVLARWQWLRRRAASVRVQCLFWMLLLWSDAVAAACANEHPQTARYSCGPRKLVSVLQDVAEP